MRRLLLLLSAVVLSANLAPAQIVADHTVVTRYQDIPDEYVELVKAMLVNIGGESHSAAYRDGLVLLGQQEPRYAVVTFTGTPPAADPQNPALRLGSFLRNGYGGWNGSVGEADFYANPSGRQSIKNTMQYGAESGNPLAVIGFGWCWDMTWHNGPGGTIDPVYQVRWAGSSVGGPEGDLRWGLDADDTALTGNSVSMQTYLTAVEEYRSFSQGQGYATVAIFTTGPVDGNGANENGCQREIKHQYIRDFVGQNSHRVLFDYADILTHNDAGVLNLGIWNGRTYPQIHGDNLLGSSTGHIGSVGAVRLAKAMWWMLARLAGWDGGDLVFRDGFE